MQLSLGLTLDEEMKKQVVATQNQATVVSKKALTFCGASFNGCICQNICHCVNAKSMAHCFEALLKGSQDEQSKELSIKSSDSHQNFGFDFTETEEQLHRFLKAEQSTLDVLAENESLKKFLKYMESNYKNQFETQRLIIEDMKLQVEDLMSQLKAAYNNLDQKASENEDLLNSLERRKKDYESLYVKLKEKENELEKLKNDRARDQEAAKAFNDKLDEKDRLIEELEAKLKRAEDKHKKIQGHLKEYVIELHDRERDLKNLIDGQNDALDEFQRKVDDLKRQLKDKDEDLQKKVKELNDANTKKIKDDLANKKRENDKLKDDLLQRDDELRKLKNLLQEAEDELQDQKKKGERLKEAARKADDGENAKQRQIDDLKKKLNDAESKSKDKDNLIEDLKRDIEDLRDKLRALSEENAKNKALLDFYSDELAKAKRHPVKVESSIPHNPGLSAENDELKRANDKLKDKLKALDSDYENKVKEFDDKDREAKALKKALDDLEKKIRLVTGEKDALKKLNEASMNSSSLNMATLTTELEKKNKLIKDLTDKIDKLAQENADLLAQMKALKDELEKLREANKKLSDQHAESQDLIDRLNKDKINLVKNIKNLKDEKDKLKAGYDGALKTIKDNEGEIEKLRQELAASKSAHDRLFKDNEKLITEHRELGGEYDKLKSQYQKLNQDFELMKLQFAQDRDKFQNQIGDLEITIKRLGEDTKVKDELQDTKNKQQELLIELDKKAAELKIKLDMLESLKAETRSKEIRIEELEITIKTKLGEVLNLKSELDNAYLQITELLRETWSVKIATYDLNAMLTDRDISDLKEQEKIVFTAKREQYIKMAMEIVRDTKIMLKETHEETEDLQSSVRNLSREKTALLQKKQELEEKNIDLSKRHDAKTDMVGKLTVKTFILMTEIQRLNEGAKA